MATDTRGNETKAGGRSRATKRADDGRQSNFFRLDNPHREEG